MLHDHKHFRKESDPEPQPYNSSEFWPAEKVIVQSPEALNTTPSMAAQGGGLKTKVLNLTTALESGQPNANSNALHPEKACFTRILILRIGSTYILLHHSIGSSSDWGECKLGTWMRRGPNGGPA